MLDGSKWYGHVTKLAKFVGCCKIVGKSLEIVGK
jgi:hypothetical protein